MPTATFDWSASSCEHDSPSAPSARVTSGWPGGIELRAANGRGEAANEVVGHTQLAGGFHYLVPPAGGDRRGNNMASAAARRTPRDPVVLASSRTASADGAPVARSARAAAARMRAVRIGAHHSPR